MGDSLLSGLGSFGLDGLEGMSLFEEEKKEEAKKAAYVPTEKDYLLEKTQKCPICDTEFKTKAVKAGKAKLLPIGEFIKDIPSVLNLHWPIRLCLCHLFSREMSS